MIVAVQRDIGVCEGAVPLQTGPRLAGRADDCDLKGNSKQFRMVEWTADANNWRHSYLSVRCSAAGSVRSTGGKVRIVAAYSAMSTSIQNSVPAQAPVRVPWTTS